MNLYEKFLKSQAPHENISPEEKISVSENILKSNEYSDFEKINSLVILVYKCIEIGDYEKAKSMKALVEDFAQYSKKNICCEDAFKGIRKDPGQQYISLVTVLRHIAVIERDYSFNDAKFMIVSSKGIMISV